MNYVRVFMYKRNQQLLGLNLLVVGCHTQYQEVAGVISLFWTFLLKQRIKLLT
jgi:hypothetical protein